MSSEPRMRGRRFLRTSSKKSSKRVRESENVGTYVEVKEVNPLEVTSGVLNAIDHLGNQRFALPPFAEHFERWLKDLQSLLNEFETQIPQAVDTNLHNEFIQSMNNIRNVLAKRTELENIQSIEATKLLEQLARCEAELARLEHAYKIRTQEIRRQHEKSDQKLRAEIDRLDRKRMQILRENASIFRRIFHKSDTAIRGTNIALESKKADLKDSASGREKALQKRRDEYGVNQRRLLTEIEILRQKIRESRNSDRDDTLESRTEACKRISAAISSAMQRIHADTDKSLSSPKERAYWKTST
jgi:vacuolar-type H+-ATPase subunit I/STV1